MENNLLSDQSDGLSTRREPSACRPLSRELRDVIRRTIQNGFRAALSRHFRRVAVEQELQRWRAVRLVGSKKRKFSDDVAAFRYDALPVTCVRLGDGVDVEDAVVATWIYGDRYFRVFFVFWAFELAFVRRDPQTTSELVFEAGNGTKEFGFAAERNVSISENLKNTFF